MTKNLIAVSAVMLMTSCASILAGTSQTLNINSTPQGAKCDLNRYESSAKKENVIASVAATPGQATIKKTKYDITVKCNKSGYKEGSAIMESGSEGKTVGNIILGGGIGWAVDSAVGADNKYPENINVPLEKK